MSKIFDDVLNQIDRGRSGLNKGLPMGFNRLAKYIPNIQQATYYLIGASTKVGKTSFTDDCFMYNPYDFISNNETDMIIDIDYYSFEVEKKLKIIKGISRKIWKDYGLIVDVNSILSRGQNHCSDEIYDLVKSTREYFEPLEDCITIHDIPENPTGIFKYLKRKAETLGEVHNKTITLQDGTTIEKFDKFIPNNPNRYWIIIIDHISLAESERGYNTKETIDKLSQYLVYIRNNYSAIPVVIQQLAFDSMNDERHRSGRLVPSIKDFGDSKYTTRDASVIMALFNPAAMQMNDFQGYKIDKLRDSFRNLEILVNRDGMPNINIGLNYIGPAGTFRELPTPDKMTDDIYDKAVNYVNSNVKYIKENNIWKLK